MSNIESTAANPVTIDDDIRWRLELLRNYANNDIAQCDRMIAEKQAKIDEYNYVRRRVEDFPKKLRKEDWLPVNSVGFIQGTYTDTNRFLTSIGSQYMVERSSAETVEFLNRRIKAVQSEKESYESHKKLTEERLSFAQDCFQAEASGIVEIKEPYDPELAKAKSEKGASVSEKEFDDVMTRLEELEKSETANNEMSDVQETAETTEEEPESNAVTELIKALDIVEKDSNDEPKKTPPSQLRAPKGVSQKDFERLVEQVNDLIASSDEDSEEYEDEDFDYDDDDEPLDSDDSLPPPKDECDKKEAPQPTQPPGPIALPPTEVPKKKRSVCFSEQLESGPTEKTALSPAGPKPILRNKDQHIPINRRALKRIEENERPVATKERNILPASNAFTGVFVERNVHNPEPSTSSEVVEETKKPVSRFRALRKGHKTV